jgi:DNA repair exonuclease SbcCD ATPase subunit
MDKILSFLPVLNLLFLFYFLYQSRHWTGIALHLQLQAIKEEVDILRANYRSLKDELEYYARVHNDTNTHILEEVRAVNVKLARIEEFHDRLSVVESNCLMHEQSNEIKKALDSLKREK